MNCNELWPSFIYKCREVLIKMDMINLEPIRVGAGKKIKLEPIRVGRGKKIKPYSTIDDTVLRTIDLQKGIKVPVIPGSSLKGVLRTASMILLLGKGYISSHSGVENDNCIDQIFGESKKFDGFRKKASINEVLTILKGMCPTCILYGAPGISSKVYVGDFKAYPDKYIVSVKTGIGINRRTGSTELLYNIRYVEPNSRFYGEIRLYNTPNWLLSLFGASLMLIDDGWIKIGGHKSRGMGRVKFIKESVEIVIEKAVLTNNKLELEKIDNEIDEKDIIEIKKDGERGECKALNNTVICRGREAYSILRELNRLWFEKYSSKAKKVIQERFEKAKEKVEYIVK